MSTAYSTWIACAPGLEQLVAAELKALGLSPKGIEPGGMTAAMSPSQLYAANLHLSIASRVTVRIGKFHAAEFWELEKRAERLAWHAWIPKGSTVQFRVTSRKSKLYHNDAIAERLGKFVAAKVPGVTWAGTEATEEDSGPAEPSTLDPRLSEHDHLILVRLVNDEVTISIDSSGELLYRRGWRQETAKAPLRETLAAAMLSVSGWEGKRALHDPFCGAGTIVIEAARKLKGIPAGWDRSFAFERWPTFDAAAYADVRETAKSSVRRPLSVPLLGTDHDPGAIRAALANARRAGVADLVQFAEADIRDLPAEEGVALVANPPYGVRVGEGGDVSPLYTALGKLSAPAGSSLTFLSPDHTLTKATRVTTKTAWKSSNGGIPVECMVS
ncbi:MAG: class I SAM-dependent RNA methyltransferase [Actinomycetota bacterium]|nr:class I SAM-dependent RNA methyltransferase [Actinomycetota bacterium]